MIHVSGADVYQKQSFADVLQNRCSCKFRKFHRKAPVLEWPFNKVAGLKAYQFVEKRLQHPWFHVKFLRKSCFTEHLSLVAASGLWLFTPAKFILGSLMAIFRLWCHHLHIKDVSYYSYICPRLHITAGEIINKLSVEALKSVQVNYFSRIVKSNRISSLRGVFRTLSNICDCTFCDNNETLRSSRPEVFCKKGVVRNFTKLFSGDVCEISKNTFFHRKSLLGASETLIAVNYFGKIIHLGCSTGFCIGLC